jgi:hypothetical protein
MEFDSDTKINDYLNAEIGKRKLHYQNIFESNQRNFRNIFKTRFPLLSIQGMTKGKGNLMFLTEVCQIPNMHSTPMDESMTQ